MPQEHQVVVVLQEQPVLVPQLDNLEVLDNLGLLDNLDNPEMLPQLRQEL